MYFLGSSLSVTKLGKMFDRRLNSFCQEISILPEQLYKGNHTFIFIVSSGHAGTTYLGQSSVWRKHFGRVLPSGYFITHELGEDRELLRQIPWGQQWCDAAIKYVIEKKLPEMEGVLHFSNLHTYFSSGHQIILGLLPALVKVLGNNAKFIRLRRNRLNTAYSYATEKQTDPCHVRCSFWYILILQLVIFLNHKVLTI